VQVFIAINQHNRNADNSIANYTAVNGDQLRRRWRDFTNDVISIGNRYIDIHNPAP
jgi:hypothetical protein